MDGSPAWLVGIPTDGGYVLVAAALALASTALRIVLETGAPGRALRRAVHTAEGALLALLLAAMIAFSFLQIVLRNVVDTGLIWIDPFLRHLVLWVGFLGATLATRKGHHINVDALSRFLPKTMLRVVRVATNLVATVTCLLLSNACMKLVRDEAEFGSVGFLDLPVWMLQAIMPLALLVMASRFLGHAADAARGHLLHESGGESPSEPESPVEAER